MIDGSDIQEQLSRYLGNQISLDEFEGWFVQASWDAHRESDPLAFKLVSAIELKLAEYSSGHLLEADLQEEIRALTEPRFVYFSFPQGSGQPVLTGASNHVPFQGVVQPSYVIFSAAFV